MSNINLIMPVEWPALITNSLPKASALHACKQTRCRSAYLWVPLQQLQGNAGQGKACCRLPSNVLCTQVVSCLHTHGCWKHTSMHLSLLDVYLVIYMLPHLCNNWPPMSSRQLAPQPCIIYAQSLVSGQKDGTSYPASATFTRKKCPM